MISKAHHTRIKLIFLFGAILLFVLSFLSYTRINNLIDQSKWVNHSSIVKLSLEKIFTALSEKESNMRGYMLTKDSVSLASYRAADTSINLELNNFESITKDNPAQQQNAIELRTAINVRVERMNHNLALFQASNVSIPDLLTGKALMDTVRTQIDKMGNVEDRELSVRSAVFRKSEFLSPFFTVVLIIGSIAILIASYFKIMV